MHHCPDTPFLLVGNNMESKSSLFIFITSYLQIIYLVRTDPDLAEDMRSRGQAPVSYEDVSIYCSRI